MFNLPGPAHTDKYACAHVQTLALRQKCTFTRAQACARSARVLQCVARVLQCVAVCLSVLQCVDMQCPCPHMDACM